MNEYAARRVRFQNGERFSVLVGRDGTPVHLAVLFLARYRTRGRAANTIHQVCQALAVLHGLLEARGLDLQRILDAGRFLDTPDVYAIVETCQLSAGQTDTGGTLGARRSGPINIHRLMLPRGPARPAIEPVGDGTRSSRLRNIAAYLDFAADYLSASLPREVRRALLDDTSRGVAILKASIPRGGRRAQLGARKGLTPAAEHRLMQVCHPDSPENPWKQPFVRARNWLIVALLLSGGMRRGELLGLQVGDLVAREPKLRIIRRADAPEDARREQPNVKTADREIELQPAIMRRLAHFIDHDRRAIPNARKVPQIFTSDEGKALSLSSIDKLFAELRRACHGLPERLSAHVLRHTWNDRFSEQAESLGLTDKVEQDARSSQQGWASTSKMAATYTRRHTERTGRQVALRLQKEFERKLDGEG